MDERYQQKIIARATSWTEQDRAFLCDLFRKAKSGDTNQRHLWESVADMVREGMKDEDVVLSLLCLLARVALVEIGLEALRTDPQTENEV